MAENSVTTWQPKAFLRLLPKLLAICLVLGALSILALASLTDFGAGGNRDLRVGFSTDADWLLHLHRPGELLTVLSSDLDSDLLTDPNWRWLLGLPENPESALDPRMRAALADAELLLAFSWAGSQESQNSGDTGSDRLLAAFRPTSTLIPRLIQAASRQFIYERFVANQIPRHLSPSWLNGLIHLGGIDGQGGLVVGSSRDLVVVGSRYQDVCNYLTAQKEAPDQGQKASEDRLELSSLARKQLQEASKRVLGDLAVATAGAIIGPAEAASALTIVTEPTFRLQFRGSGEQFRGHEPLAQSAGPSLLVATSLSPERFLPHYFRQSFPDLSASAHAACAEGLAAAAPKQLSFAVAPAPDSGSGLQFGLRLECQDPEQLLAVDALPAALAATARVENSALIFGSYPAESATAPGRTATTGALALRAPAPLAQALVASLLSHRLALEAAPKEQHLERIRKQLSAQVGAMSDQDFQYQLQLSRAERLRRVEREMACWGSLLGQGFSWTTTLVDGLAQHELRFGAAHD